MNSLNKRHLAELMVQTCAVCFLTRDENGFRHDPRRAGFSERATTKALEQLEKPGIAGQICQEPGGLKLEMVSVGRRETVFEVTGELTRHGISGDQIVLQTSGFCLRLTCELDIPPRLPHLQVTDFSYEILD